MTKHSILVQRGDDTCDSYGYDVEHRSTPQHKSGPAAIDSRGTNRELAAPLRVLILTKWLAGKVVTQIDRCIISEDGLFRGVAVEVFRLATTPQVTRVLA